MSQWRWLRWPALAVAAALLGCAVWWWPHVWYWIEVHTGTVNEASPYYGFWSGFGSDLGEVALLGAIAGGWHKLNCEVKGCWRIGRHTTAAGHCVCRRHHPDGAPTHADVVKAHNLAKLLHHHRPPGDHPGGAPT